MLRCMLRAGLGLLILLALAWAAPVDAQAMKIAAESIPIPTDGRPKALTEVRYGVTWTVEFNAIRLVVESEPGADTVKVVWTVTGVNSRPRPTRAMLTVVVLNGDGKSVATAKKSLMVKPGGEPHEYEIDMKMKAAEWERAERVMLQANFFIAS